jgi:predicted metal-dependent hydrolase
VTPEQHQVQVGDKVIRFTLKRSKRQTLGISILPTDEILVTAPVDADLISVKERVQKRAGWILKWQSISSRRPAPSSDRHYVPGESHLFLGRQYRLKVDPDTRGVRREGGRIVVGGVEPSEPSRVRNRLNRWYAREARSIYSERLTACLKLFRHDSITRPTLKVKPLAKRWGSYVRGTHSLILNRHLVRMPVPMIDYVIVHELCHVYHPNHGQGFLDALTAKMPDWRKRRDDLNRFE